MWVVIIQRWQWIGDAIEIGSHLMRALLWRSDLKWRSKHCILYTNLSIPFTLTVLLLFGIWFATWDAASSINELMERVRVRAAVLSTVGLVCAFESRVIIKRVIMTLVMPDSVIGRIRQDSNLRAQRAMAFKATRLTTLAPILPSHNCSSVHLNPKLTVGPPKPTMDDQSTYVSENGQKLELKAIFQWL